MLSFVTSSTPHGVDALPITIETHVESGLPRYTVVGLPDGAVRESRDRIFAALKTTGLPMPRGAVTVNLAPADVRKEGAAFDLPIALGLTTSAARGEGQAWLDDMVVVGELALDGSVRPVRGVLAMALEARRRGKLGVIVPAENASEASVVGGLDVYGVTSITEAFALMRGEDTAAAVHQTDAADLLGAAPQAATADFRDVRGQAGVKRALEVAAAGGHNVLMVGPPGSGKTMLARRLPTILPPMSLDEALETTKIHSVAGVLPRAHGLVTLRPFRAPHHTISDAGLCGGGASPQPGEISLAHHGVLFLDELPEFKRAVLEVLRQPLEEGFITISRARGTVCFPASFMLVASMNPCPCGHLNDPMRTCCCAPVHVQRYLSRVSGPLLDRIDLHVEVAPVPIDALQGRRPAEGSTDVRARVSAARALQADRYAATPGVHANAHMPPALLLQHARLGTESQQLVKLAVQRLGLSARAYDRIRKVARTIADLEAAAEIQPHHVSEAIQYRALDREQWGVGRQALR